MLSQPKSAVHQQAAKLFQQHCMAVPQRELHNLNSAFEKADRLLEQKRKRSHLSQNRQLTILRQRQFASTGRKIFFVFQDHWSN